MAHETEDMFSKWEVELNSNHEFIPIHDTLTLAQELQIDIAQQPFDYRKIKGLDALHLINQMQPDIRHKKFAMKVLRAYALLECSEEDDTEKIATQFGEMRLGGQIGHYTFWHTLEESTLALQVFEPKQYSVSNPEIDTISKRLPVPLSIPVLAIDNLIQLR